MTRRIMLWTGEQLAKWLHEWYEEFSARVGWRTQGQCRVPFEELPEKNKKVMLLIAQMIQLELIDVPTKKELEGNTNPLSP